MLNPVVFDAVRLAFHSMSMRTSSSPTRAVRGLVLVTLMTLAMTACSGTGRLTETSTEKAADRHATVAGTVMIRDNWERSANDAAYLVVGKGVDDTIDALDVEGTTYHGAVVLRITVESSTGFGDGPATKCYRYMFRHEMGDENPDNVSCTNHVVTLTQPTPEPEFDPAAEAKFASVLRRLVADHTTDAGTVDQQVRATFGPPVTVQTGPAGLDHGTNNGTLFIRLDVPSHGECMWAFITTAGHITTGTGNHRNCPN